MRRFKMTRRGVMLLGSAIAVSLAVSGPATAQNNTYPNRDITFVVPYAPGATGDILSRRYTALLSEALGVTVVVSNVSGGSGTIGSVEIFGAEPDGYTIGYGHNSPLAIQPHKNAGLPYKNADDFTTIGGIGHQSGTVSVNSASKYKTFAEFVEAAKADPGGVSIAVGGSGNVKDLQLQQFQKAAGVEFNIVPFAGGGAEAVLAVMGQIVDGVSVGTPSVRGQIASGDIRPLAIFADLEMEEVEGFKVITHKEFPGLQYLQDSTGVIGPKGIPDDILATLEAAHLKIMANKDFVATLEADGYIVDGANSKDYREQLLKDYVNFGEVLGK